MSKLGKKGAAVGRHVASPRPAISTQNYFKTKILAQCASAAPPLGPLLGQFGLNISNFCKDFNEKTKHYKKGIPLPINVRIKADRSCDIQIQTPPIPYYLKQAAGIFHRRLPGETKVGEITLKHVYEIARIKYEDPHGMYQVMELEEVVKHVVGLAKYFGIELVDKIDPEKYKQFLEERKAFVKAKLIEIEEQEKLKFQRL